MTKPLVEILLSGLLCAALPGSVRGQMNMDPDLPPVVGQPALGWY